MSTSSEPSVAADPRASRSSESPHAPAQNPAWGDGAPAPQSAPDGPSSASSPHILVVDDDPSVLELEAIRLARLGYAVTTTGCGDVALQMLEAHPNDFDVMLTDYQMPGMSGLALAGAVQDAGRAIPTVMMLGFAAQVSEEAAREAGVSALLQKPVRSAELDAALEQVLQAYGVSS